MAFGIFNLFLYTFLEAEKIASQEVKRLVGQEPVIDKPGLLILKIKDFSQLLYCLPQLAFFSQSLEKIGLPKTTAQSLPNQQIDQKNLSFLDYDLGKRYYKVFPHSRSLKAPLAYFLVKKSGFSSHSRNFLSFYAEDGLVGIEAALSVQHQFFRQEEKPALLSSLVKFILPFLPGSTSPEDLALKMEKIVEKERIKQEKTKIRETKDKEKNNQPEIILFDQKMPNLQAAQKNALVARVEVNFCSHLEELQGKKFLHLVIKKGFSQKRLQRLEQKQGSHAFQKFWLGLFDKLDNFTAKKSQLVLCTTPHQELSPLLHSLSSWKLIEDKSIQKGEQLHQIFVLKKLVD